MIVTTVIGTDPLTLSDIKAQLNVTFNEDDNFITSYIGVSLNAVENYCRSSFLQRKNVENVGKFEDGVLPSFLTTDMTDKPVGNVTVTYSVGTISTHVEVPPVSQYTISKDHYIYREGFIIVSLADTVTVDVDTDVTIEWVTGVDVIEPAILQARLLLCSTYYENRESDVVGISATDLPSGTKFLLEPFMNPQVG